MDKLINLVYLVDVRGLLRPMPAGTKFGSKWTFRSVRWVVPSRRSDSDSPEFGKVVVELLGEVDNQA